MAIIKLKEFFVVKPVYYRGESRDRFAVGARGLQSTPFELDDQTSIVRLEDGSLMPWHFVALATPWREPVVVPEPVAETPPSKPRRAARPKEP
jgi:hypothetical protein